MDILRRYSRNLPLLLVIAGVVGSLLMYFTWDIVSASNLYDRHDIGYFFQYSQWAEGKGVLYKDVYSDYLLLANLLFGVFHFLAATLRPLSTTFKSFSWLWASAAWFLYLWVAYLIYTKISRRAIWIWLSPAPIYFAFIRYEIYLVVLTIFFLFALEREKYFESALWLGAVIALKGYALFAIPPYAVFIFYRKGLATAIKLTAVCLAPYILSHLIVFAYAGLEGVGMPYRFQGNRPSTPESLYSVISYILFLPERLLVPARLTHFLILATSLIAAALRPKTFEEVVHALMLAISGFITFGNAPSPQFLLWIVPMACFSSSRNIRQLTIFLSWLTFFDYPVAQYFVGSRKFGQLAFSYGAFSFLIGQTLFRIVMVILTAARFVHMYLTYKQVLIEKKHFDNKERPIAQQ